jgi:hypothetical protein
LEAGHTPHLGILNGALDYIEARRDCADFILHSVLRMLYQFFDNPALPPELFEHAKEILLGFKYWPDEPGIDSMCTWTENRYILFASAGLLAGQLFPQEVFTNSGQTGIEKMALSRERILKWMNLRFFTGFSEWLSHIYYDEDLTALLSLVDFCQDQEISNRATILVDMILFDMALNNYKGVFASTHGLSYENTKKWAAQENTSDTQKLLFGRGRFSADDNMSAVSFALSKRYQLPCVLYQVANDQNRSEMLSQQRMGIRLDQAAWWGLRTNNFEDGMSLLTLGAYFHTKTAKVFTKMLDAYKWWDNFHFSYLNKYRRRFKFLRIFGLLPLYVNMYEWDVCRTTREEVNIITYRTPDYMLSSASDYRKGYGGDQQHIWQATLGPDAVCFTTHPGKLSGTPPNYWTGSGTLPRVAQIKNVLIAIYKISNSPALFVPDRVNLTHAWLPRDHFDEVVERDDWILARRGDGYLALRSEHPYIWRTTPGEDQDREVSVRGRNNIWLCELGRRAVDGEFAQFVEKITSAELKFSRSGVKYDSPSQGQIEFGWHKRLLWNEEQVQLTNYPRYQNPYAQAKFPLEQLDVSLEGHSLHLDWLNNKREASEFI